ncbi:MAG: hypothetical protein GY816_15815 [Cytophagales bacterium]|nr:hypothetical protein [Cytophagales bacterium]
MESKTKRLATGTVSLFCYCREEPISNYTISQIEDALNGQTTWNGWRNNIRNRYNNATKDNLDELFAHWN